MSMHEPTDPRRALIEAHKARRARIEARAREEARKRAEAAQEASQAPRVRKVIPSYMERREAALRAAFDAVPAVFKTRPAWRVIAKQVCEDRRANYDDVMSERRHAYLVTIRHEIWYRIRTELGMSYPEIGKRFNKDHTTILHGVRKHAARLNLELPE